MRIAFLNVAEEWGGGEGWTLRTALGLAGRGHAVLMLARGGSPLADRARRAELPTATPPVGMDYSPRTIAALLRLLRRNRIEVLVVHQNKDVRTGGVAARLLGIPVVHRNGFPILKNNFRHRLTYRLTDRILTNSARIRDRYLEYGWVAGDRVDVVPNGVAAPDAPGLPRAFWTELGLNPEGLVALYAGRLTGVKRVSDLLDAFADLPESSRWQLAIVGDGSRLPLLADRIGEHPRLLHRCVLLGFREDAAALTGIADLVLLPSEDEGMPNTLMEAMARGTAVAATPVGDVPLLLDGGNAGWLLPVREPERWSKLLMAIESDPACLPAMADRGQHRVRDHFSHAAMIAGVEASLLRALEVRSARR